jgi:DNA integrity scanning protein DisA with diadenylate cyclase activity
MTESEELESSHLLGAAADLARKAGITTFLIRADGIRKRGAIEKLRSAGRIFWLSSSPESVPPGHAESGHVVRIPSIGVTRMSQVRIGLFLALVGGYLDPEDQIVCLTGEGRDGPLDTLFVARPRSSFLALPARTLTHEIPQTIMTVVERVLHIAMIFGSEGREGRPIGTLFVIGVTQELEPYLRQFVLNPCAGHPPSSRNIHSPEFLETLREFSALDGAFVVSTKGIVESAGTYVDAIVSAGELPLGLGARHAAGSAITKRVDCLAVVLSESSHGVTVFHGGKVILEFETMRSIPPKHAHDEADPDKGNPQTSFG